MKKLKVLIASIIFMSALFVGCKNSVDDQSSDSENLEKDVIKFNMGSFNALGIVDGEESGRSAVRGARAAGNSLDNMIVKILEDGSMESFITVPENVNLAPVNYIARSPAADAKEIYIVFRNETSWRESAENEKGGWDWVNYSIGQLLCVKEDGSYIDVLEKKDGTHQRLYSSTEDSIAFDETGCMYYLAYEYNGNNNTNMIYKFNPKNGNTTQLTQAVTNTSYQKMQVSKDGQWIFTKASRWNDNSSTQYLRAIQTVTPDKFENLFYTSDNSSWINDWYYDDDTLTIYYIQDSTIYSITQKNGSFSKDNRVTLFSSNNNGYKTLYSDALLSWNNNSQVYTWKGCSSANDITDDNDNCSTRYYYFRNPDSAENEVQPEEILAYLYADAYRSLDSNKVTWSQWKEDYKNHKYEIRFDKFAEVEGYEVLASLTKGKSDLELINAIIDNNLEELVYNLLKSDAGLSGSRYSPHRYFNNFYENNFYADVLYEKTTGKTISTDLFKMQTWGSTSKYSLMGPSNWELFTSSWSNRRTWKKEFLDNKEVQPDLVLKTLAEYCGKKEIDFSLECFKDDLKYSILYTELKNDDAVKFLDTPARLSKLGDFFNDNDNYDDRNGYGKFLLKTCFAKDTDYKIPAYTWRTSDVQTIWWRGVGKLTPSYQKSLYGVYNYNNGNSTINGLVKIVNEAGEVDGEMVNALNDYKISDIIPSDTGFYFKSALLDSANEESGFHQIVYFNAVDSTCTNLFDKIAQNTTLEVISFSVGGNYLYFCAAKGLTVINGKIDLTTKNYTELQAGTKLTQIITVK